MVDFKHNYDGIDMGEGRLELPKRVTAASDEGRAWFARGWLHILNYNHEEAIECFKHCICVEDMCIMALWGIGECSDSSRLFVDSLIKFELPHRETRLFEANFSTHFSPGRRVDAPMGEICFSAITKKAEESRSDQFDN